MRKVLMGIVGAGLLASYSTGAEAALCNAQAFAGGTFGCVAEQGMTYDFPLPLSDYTIAPGGNISGVDGENNVEKTVHYITGSFVDLQMVADLTQSGSGFTFTPTIINTGNSFDWSYVGPYTLKYLTIKAANSFVIFDITGQTSGSATTTGYINTGGPTINGKDISHVVFWGGPSEDVMEPAALGLLGLGLAGLGLAQRRRRTA